LCYLWLFMKQSGCFRNPSISLQPFTGPRPLFSFLIFYTVGRTQSVARRNVHTQTAETQNTRTQTTMPQVGYEPTIPVSERVKTVHALDRAATVSCCFSNRPNYTFRYIGHGARTRERKWINNSNKETSWKVDA
jgi:hypothetical protein